VANVAFLDNKWSFIGWYSKTKR